MADNETNQGKTAAGLMGKCARHMDMFYACVDLYGKVFHFVANRQ